MPRIAILALSMLVATAAFAIRPPEPIAVVDGQPVYGAAMPDGAVTDIGAALAAVDQYVGTPQKFSGRITKVCQKRGCWAVLANGTLHARVMFGRDEFSIPTDSSGPAVVYGTLNPPGITDAMAEHLAKDEGSNATPSAKASDEVQIMATSVMLTPAD